MEEEEDDEDEKERKKKEEEEEKEANHNNKVSIKTMEGWQTVMTSGFGIMFALFCYRINSKRYVEESSDEEEDEE